MFLTLQMFSLQKEEDAAVLLTSGKEKRVLNLILSIVKKTKPTNERKARTK